MSLGIISDDDFLNELNNFNGTKVNGVIVDKSGSGRNNGDKEVGENVRKIISEESIVSGSVGETARAFGVSSSSVSAYKNGVTSTAFIGNKPDVPLMNHARSVKERIVRRATKKLGLALDTITEDKLAAASLRESAATARDMASIVQMMSPSDDNDKGNKMNVQFVLHAPSIRSESEYEVIDLNER